MFRHLRNQRKTKTRLLMSLPVAWASGGMSPLNTRRQRITVLGPDGRAFSREFKGGVTPEFALTDSSGERLPDGQYTYELRLAPIMTRASKESLAALRGADDDKESVRAERKRGASPGLVQSGSFSILNGTVIVPGAIEEPGARRGNKSAQQLQPYATCSIHVSLQTTPATSSNFECYVRSGNPR